MPTIELSVIILCYKSGSELIPYANSIIEELNSIQITHELILVCNYDKGDGINNKTYQVASIIKQSNFDNTQIVFKEKNGGMGWDLKTGIQACKGKYICFLDGDGQTHPKDITILYQTIEKNQYTLVKTYRNIRHDGWFRKIQSLIYNLLFNWKYSKGYQKIKDVNSKPKMALSSTFESLDLKSDDWFIDAEIIIKLLESSQEIIEIPTEFFANTHRKSFVNWSTIAEFLKNMIFKPKDFNP